MGDHLAAAGWALPRIRFWLIHATAPRPHSCAVLSTAARKRRPCPSRLQLTRILATAHTLLRSEPGARTAVALAMSNPYAPTPWDALPRDPALQSVNDLTLAQVRPTCISFTSTGVAFPPVPDAPARRRRLESGDQHPPSNEERLLWSLACGVRQWRISSTASKRKRQTSSPEVSNRFLRVVARLADSLFLFVHLSSCGS